MASRRWVAWGTVALVLASGTTIAPSSADPLKGPASIRLDNPFERVYRDSFGEAIGFAGDVDGDGYDELLVAAPTWNGRAALGRVSIYPGSSEGVRDTPVALTPPEDAFLFGLSLAAAGDVDGDGYDDVLVGEAGAGYLYPGSAAGLGEPVEIAPPGASPGDIPSVAGAGDVDGDGYDDVVVGHAGWDGGYRNQGRVYLFRGSASGLVLSPWVEISGVLHQGGRFGGAVASAGDVDGDGFDDIMVGAPGWNDGSTQRPQGRGFVYLGSPDGLERPGWHVDPADPAFRGFPPFSTVLGAAGDVDGDGYDDIAFGLPYHRRERIHLYLGSADGPTRPAQIRLARGSNGFGSVVTGVGDLDGDGFDDVVVGAPSGNGDRPAEGRTYTFRGSRHGLSRHALVRQPADQLEAYFGSAITGGGDVNGDGAPDLAVSAPEFRGELDRGRVYVYD